MKVVGIDFEAAKIRVAQLIGRTDLIINPADDKGLTLEEYAEAKRLPREFLIARGVRQQNYFGKPAIRIPYFRNEQDENPSIKFRLSLTGQTKTRWKRGDRTTRDALRVDLQRPASRVIEEHVAAIDAIRRRSMAANYSGICTSARDRLRRDLTEPDFLLGQFISTTSRMLLVAPTGLGKTNLAMAVGAAIADGADFLHWIGCGRQRHVLVGWYWRNWGVAGGSGVWNVYHLPSGRYVTSFSGASRTARSIAKRFCEEADQLADWTAPPADDPTIGLRLHRIARRLSGGRPDLRLLQGGAKRASP
jgi:hypothetical protein